MSVFAKFSRRQIGLFSLFLALVLIVGAAVWWVLLRPASTVITAYFERSVAIYPGSDVKILGVEVGKVDSVTPQGTQVKVVMSVDGGIDIPAQVKAVQITPSVVPDRFIQLTPAYSGGPKMGETATIPLDRTATPVEVDQLYKSVSDISKALGPDGVNKDGALSNLVNTAAANLNGNGETLAETITKLSAAARTLSDSRGDIFSTVRNLQTFVSALAANDQQVRQFNDQMAQFSGFLDGERQDLAQAVQQLSYALGDVARFVGDNKQKLESNVNGLASVTGTIAKNKAQLAESLEDLPLAIANLINAYDPDSATLQMRVNIPELQNPLGALCKMLDLGKLMPGDPQFDALSRQMAPLIDNCSTIANQITAGIKTPTLNLPFGIMSGDNQQRNPVPGTVPGTPSPRLQPGFGTQGGGR
ncbi:MCE family protein [Rhodococcus sp. D2-41]|uniref:MCE family protein n=1 Tax=Speluncibacter jeojiensis TaxID=2710754 RepID=A0A9X4REQ4_9ACTN|nr:MCE family protein [Rhodococcus sp. D2-41]MDG3009167.1 MCE family protein [Rhodococcus sp. D2-41]MDG3016160.1 MCE family protein [Corynebacteriales bacterium D3-21]